MTLDPVHSFHFSDDIIGYVLSLAAPPLKPLKIHLGNQQNLLDQLASLPLAKHSAPVDAMFTLLNDEYLENALGRQLLLESTVTALMVLLSREAADQIQGQEVTTIFAINASKTTNR